MTARAVELAQVAITVALGAAVIWRGLMAHRLGELWWCCLLVTICAVLGIDAVATGLDAAANLSLSGLLARLGAVSAVALAVRWLLRHREMLAGGNGARRLAPEARVAVALTTVAAVLVVTWLPDAHVGSAPGPADGLIAVPHRGVFAVLHWGVFAASLLVLLVVFLRVGLRAVDLLPTVRLRASLLLLLIAAAALFLWVVCGTVGSLAGPWGPMPEAVRGTLDYLLTAVFVLFAVAVLAPLPPGARNRPRLDDAAVYAELISLWTWITRSAPAPRLAAHRPDVDTVPDIDTVPDVDTVLDLVIEIRDQFHDLQRFLTAAAVTVAAASSRRLQLSGIDPGAWATAVCLELASAARLRGEPATCAGVDLSTLGGGECLATEAEWLAGVSGARRAGAAEAARWLAATDQGRYVAVEPVGTLT